MTLCVALKGADGLVLAADSRGTFGDPRGVTAQNDAQKKAHILSRRSALLMAGAGELGATILAQPGISGANDGVTAAMEGFRQAARASYGNWLPHLPPAVPQGVPQLMRPSLEFIIAGYDDGPDDGPPVARIYSLTSALDFPPMLHEYGFALQGIPQYALYLLNRMYEADRSLADLTALAVYAITETASQDGKVGGPVRVITIRPTEGCAELPDGEVARVVEENRQRSESLRRSFYRQAPDAEPNYDATGKESNGD